MFDPRSAIDQNILEENQGNPPYCRQENRLHEGLKRRRTVREAKRHDKKFGMPFVRPKPALLNVWGMSSYLMITQSEVELGEDLSVAEFIKEFFDSHNGETVIHCNRVQGAVIYTKSP